MNVLVKLFRDEKGTSYDKETSLYEVKSKIFHAKSFSHPKKGIITVPLLLISQDKVKNKV